jgi:hypothetical protein
MISEVRTYATVQPGGLIKVRSNELLEGATVEVIVRINIHSLAEAKAKGLSRFIGAAKGGFSSVAEVDTYIRQERDSWDS